LSARSQGLRPQREEPKRKILRSREEKERKELQKGLNKADQITGFVDSEDEGDNQENDEDFDTCFDLWTSHGAGR